MDTKDLVAEYEEIMADIKEKAERALRIVRMFDDLEHERAKGYWYAHIVTNIDNDHDFMGREMCTMQDSLEAIQNAECKKVEDVENDD